ncbi:unnamed protein product [Leptosia nina]|uniref:Trissin n=1 Tax=Leptosia nina TaxID=320188 RepID=A0AAV1J3B6_9NEOP
MWVVALNCQSCGQECEPACGTRYFRTCCFNYLRRKRGSHTSKMSHYSPNEILLSPKMIEDLEFWSQDPINVLEV